MSQWLNNQRPLVLSLQRAPAQMLSLRGLDPAFSLLQMLLMEFICRHCNEVSDGDAYRVSSEENGVKLLDMIVCYQCSLEARGLELATQKIDLPSAGSAEVVFH